jgi:lysozyme family protein
MSSKFNRALAYVLENEGVDSDHPADAGGRTRYGITEATARRHGYDVRKLTKAQAATIYRRDYWRYEAIADEALSIKVFDFAVNAGVERANKLLQIACNDLGSCLTVDGVLGPKSLLAINSLKAWDLMKRFAERQAEYYEEIVRKNPSQKVFARGWQLRAARVPITIEA